MHQHSVHMTSSMPESSNLSTLARSKLHLSVGGKDNCSLHRWVLLKNSIIRSQPLTSSAATTDHPDINHVYSLGDGDEEVGAEEEEDSFMFPDAEKLVENRTKEVNSSEAEWLDSLLETLGDDDDDEFNPDSDIHAVHPVDDDEDQLLSPLLSPLSSSDDLPTQLTYYPPPTPVSDPVPYSPFPPPLIHSYEFDSTFDSSSLTSIPSPYDDPLPYLDDVEDLSIPDAIEDTSDDESDAPPTPSIGQSASFLTVVDPASIPLPAGRSRRRHPLPLVFIDMDDSYFYPFELDPLPFPDDHHSSFNGHQRC
jgi:hypothetical protein